MCCSAVLFLSLPKVFPAWRFAVTLPAIQKPQCDSPLLPSPPHYLSSIHLRSTSEPSSYLQRCTISILNMKVFNFLIGLVISLAVLVGAAPTPENDYSDVDFVRLNITIPTDNMTTGKSSATIPGLVSFLQRLTCKQSRV